MPKVTKKPASKAAKKTAKPAKAAPARKTAAKPKVQAKKPTPTKSNVKAMPTKKSTASATAKKATTAKKPTKVNLEAGYKPSDKEEYMSDMQLAYFRTKLVAWKEELSRELKETMDNLKEENWQEPDMTDRATVETDAGLELRTRDRYRKLINKINDALIRIEKGTYGYCEETGDEIGLKRLEARPIATLSIEAQERHERDERTHYDEDMEERLG